MTRLRLLTSRMVTVPMRNSRPYADWFADVTRRIERRTGSWRGINLMSEAYWKGCYYNGVSAWDAADQFIEESRNVL
jgi:hypothetical protein